MLRETRLPKARALIFASIAVGQLARLANHNETITMLRHAMSRIADAETRDSSAPSAGGPLLSQ